MRKLTDRPTRRQTALRPAAFRGFTLLELLIVLLLMATLLVGMSSIVRLFSRNYAANERRVGRAQLARSISQMLSDDLGAAVQDPILSVGVDPTRQYVRHFGLRGDSRSLQIDVVQPSSFVPTADATENRRIMAGGEKNGKSKQVPELKTIFYEFVPLNDVQKLPGESTDDSSPLTSIVSAGGADLGSSLAGSLARTADAATDGLDASETDESTLFWDGLRPFAQKFGLSRRELDYETPDEDSEESATQGFTFTGDEAGADVSALAGSLAFAPDASASAFSSASSADLAALTGDGVETPTFLPPMTAAQIAMDSDDGTTWAPEVLDCRFSYFDGDQWFDSWDSLEKNGLPVAIKVELKLAPLDDVDLYRTTPLIQTLPLAPTVETLAKLAKQSQNAETDDGVNSSRLAGTLTGAAGTSATDAQPVDVFNSYRTPSAIRAAMTGRPASSTTSASPYAQTTESALLASTADASGTGLEDGLGTEAVSAGLGGGLGGSSSTPATSTSGASGTLGAAGGTAGVGGEGTGASFLGAAQELAASGAVYNEAGVCVDFSNDGTYMTLEQIAAELGVQEPDFYEVIAYLPTTPFSRAKTVERRQPTNVRRGTVATNNRRGNSNASRRAAGENPYATGTARAPRERQATNRTFAERQTRENQFTERSAANRGAADRGGARERTQNDRGANNRQANERGGARERVQNERGPRERVGANGGTLPIGEELAGGVGGNRGNRGDTNGGGAGDAFDAYGGSNIAGSSAPGGGFDAGTTPGGSGLGGAGLGGAGLGGGGGATSLGSLDPFAIVDQASGTLPYAESAFSTVDSSMGLTTQQGLIASPNGVGTTQTPNPSTPQTQNTQQKQTWIRGKK